MRTPLLRLLALLAALTLVASACGDDGSTEPTTPAELENYWRSQAALVDQGTAIVPEELRDDFA